MSVISNSGMSVNLVNENDKYLSPLVSNAESTISNGGVNSGTVFNNQNSMVKNVESESTKEEKTIDTLMKENFAESEVKVVPSVVSELPPTMNKTGEIQLHQISQVMQQQQTEFARQLQELHRVVNVQKALTGVDPILVVSNAATRSMSGTTATTSSHTTVTTPSPTTKRVTNKSKKIDMKELGEIIDTTGGLSSIDNLVKMIKIMKGSKDNIEKQAILVTVLQSTSNKEILKKLIEMDGLPIIYQWLSLAKKEGKNKHIKLLLKLLTILPVTINSLRSCEIGKLVKMLKKDNDNDISTRSTKLVLSWMSLVDQATNTTTTNTTTNINTNITTNNNIVNNTANSTTVPIKKRVREPASSINNNSNKLMNKKQNTNKTEDIDIQTSGINSNNTNNNNNIGINGNKVNTPEQPTKGAKHKVQLIDDLFNTTTTSSSNTNNSSNTIKSKPISNDSIKKSKIKEKLIGNKDKETITNSAVNQINSPINNNNSTSTINNNINNNNNNINNNNTIIEESKEPPNKKIKAYVDRIWEVNEEKEEEEFPPESLPGISKKTGLPKKKVVWAAADKLEAIKVFAKEEELMPSHYGGINNNNNFAMAKQMEHQKERDSMNNKKKIEEETMKKKQIAMEPTIKWRKPTTIEIPNEYIVIRGSDSKQIEIQNEREQTELSALYFDDISVPDSPFEPHTIPPDYDDNLTPIIPFDELNTINNNININNNNLLPLPLNNLPVNMPNLPLNMNGLPLNNLPLNLPLNMNANIPMNNNNNNNNSNNTASYVQPNNELLNVILNNPTLFTTLSNTLKGTSNGPPNYNDIAALNNTLSNINPNFMLPPNNNVTGNNNNNSNTNSFNYNPLLNNNNNNNSNNQFNPNNNYGPPMPMNYNNMNQQTSMNNYPPTNPSINMNNSVNSNYQRQNNQSGGDNNNNNNNSNRHDGERGRMCLFFNTPKGCRNGSSCPYIHDPNYKPDPATLRSLNNNNNNNNSNNNSNSYRDNNNNRNRGRS